MCEMRHCSCSPILKWLISICEVLLSSNRLCPHPFCYVEFCTNSTILVHLARICSINFSRLYHACRHRTTYIVSRLTKCRLPIIHGSWQPDFPCTNYFFFLQLLFALYSNYICYTFIIMLLFLQNEFRKANTFLNWGDDHFCSSSTNVETLQLRKIRSCAFRTIYLNSLFPPPYCTGQEIIL